MYSKRSKPILKLYCGKDEYLLIMRIPPELTWVTSQYEDINGDRYLYRRSKLFYDKKNEIYKIYRDGKWFNITSAIYRI